jgi:hypothetical protein
MTDRLVPVHRESAAMHVPLEPIHLVLALHLLGEHLVELVAEEERPSRRKFSDER